MSASTDSADESKDGALIDTLPPLPEALRLADQLGAELVRTVAVDMLHHNAAAELRRLHARIEADEALMKQALYALTAHADLHIVMFIKMDAANALRERLDATSK